MPTELTLRLRMEAGCSRVEQNAEGWCLRRSLVIWDDPGRAWKELLIAITGLHSITEVYHF